MQNSVESPRADFQNAPGTKNHGAKSPDVSPSGFISQSLASVPGHLLSYAGLWLFTALLIFRPGKSPDGASDGGARFSFFVAVATLLAFVITQLRLEGRLSARPREVTLVAALCGFALLSTPNALDSANSLSTFLDVFIKAVLMFIVMINVVRSERRLVGLFWLVLSAGVYLSYSALDAFRRGQFSDEGYRVRGNLGASLNDPNDTALFLVTMIPVALALMFSARTRGAKIGYALAVTIMAAAIFVTYSRGGFLALACAGIFLLAKFFRRAPAATATFALLGAFAFAFLLPGNYVGRLASIFDPNLDPRGSSSSRKLLLLRSVEVAAQNPILGVGMGNFPQLSGRNLASHNSYTQIAAEMGLPALGIYLAFLFAPLSRLRCIERETRGVSEIWQYRRLHFLAIGLQASLIGFMVGSFFLSVAYYWFLYYLVGYAVCVGRLYETGPGHIVGTFAVKNDSSP